MKRKKYKKRKIFFVPNFTLPRRKVSYTKTLRRGSFIRLLSYFWTRRNNFTHKILRRGFPNHNIHSQPCHHRHLKKTASDQKLRVHQVGIHKTVYFLDDFY